MREGEREKALHVAGTTPEPFFVALNQVPRIGRPGLTIDRHDIRVAGQDDAAGPVWTETRPKVRFAAILAGRADKFGAERAKEILDPRDQG